MSKISEPLVYIVIINWNGINDTIECLNSLETISHSNFKVVVVDNGSRNNQVDIIQRKFPKVKIIINNENLGFCVANNQGIKDALNNNAKYILLLNNDTVVSNKFLEILVNYMESHHSCGIVSPKIVYYKSNILWSMGGKITAFKSIVISIGKGKSASTYNKVLYPDFVSGCAFLIRREVVNKVGLLDPIYFAYYEDADYCLRTKKSGFIIATIPKSVIWHKKSASAGFKGKNLFSPLQCYYQTRNSIIFTFKHFNFLDKLNFIVTLLLIKIPYTVIHSGNINCIVNIARGIGSGVRNI